MTAVCGSRDAVLVFTYL